MLHIKRKPGEAVLIGARGELRVVSLNPGSIGVTLRNSMPTVATVLPFDSQWNIMIDGYPVEIHVGSVVRGEIKLGFEADRNLWIRNKETVADQH